MHLRGVARLASGQLQALLNPQLSETVQKSPSCFTLSHWKVSMLQYNPIPQCFELAGNVASPLQLAKIEAFLALHTPSTHVASP